MVNNFIQIMGIKIMHNTKNIWAKILLLPLKMIDYLSMRFIVTSGVEINANRAASALHDSSFSKSLEDLFYD